MKGGGKKKIAAVQKRRQTRGIRHGERKKKKRRASSRKRGGAINSTKSSLRKRMSFLYKKGRGGEKGLEFFRWEREGRKRRSCHTNENRLKKS